MGFRGMLAELKQGCLVQMGRIEVEREASSTGLGFFWNCLVCEKFAMCTWLFTGLTGPIRMLDRQQD